MYMFEIADTSAAEPIASWEPPLNPNQPNHKIKVPKVANGKFEPGIGLTLPSEPYLPFLAPRIIAPVSAAQPPTPCTIDEPAKSKNPASLKYPPPQDHDP